MKRFLIFCFLLCVWLLPVSSFAETPAQKVYTLSLTDAISMAKQDNTSLLVYDAQKKSAQLGGDVQKEMKKLYKGVVLNATKNLDAAYVQDGYYVEAFAMQERLADLGKKKQENTISYQVTQKYDQCKLSEALVDVMRGAFALAEKNYQTVSRQYQMGMASKLTLDNAAIAVSSAQLSLENYERAYLLAADNLKLDLHIDGEDCTLVLTDPLVVPDDFFVQEPDLTAVSASRYDICALRENADLQKLYFDITAHRTTEDVAAYQSAKASYLEAKSTYEASSKQILLGVRAAYNAVLSAKGDYQIATATLSLKEKEYETAVEKYDMGMISNMELTSALQALSQQRVNVENTKTALILSVMQYEYECLTGI